MSKLTQNYEQLAASLGFRLDAARNVIYGQRAEYEFLLFAPNPSYPYMFSVMVSAKCPMGILDKADIKQFTKSVKPIANLTQEGNLLTMILSSTPKQDKLRENVNISINALIDFMKSRGFTPCCQFCGQQTETACYVSGGRYIHLCPECAGRLRQDVTLASRKNDGKRENVIGGIVGALLGSVIGVICIVIFGQMGRVAAASGIVMAVCTIKGYELLGGKLTKKGVVISCIMMIVMTFFGNNLDWAIDIAQYYEVNIISAFKGVIPLLQEGYLEAGTYYYNLVLLYVFTAVGAVPTVAGALKERKEEGQFAQIGSMHNMN